MSSGGGDGGAGNREIADEARKAQLRGRIDALYGISPSGSRPAIVPDNGSGFGKLVTKAAHSASVGAQQDFDTNTAAAAPAAAQMAEEENQLGTSTRGYYTDALARSFGAAERNTRFNLARAGLQGGSADVDANRELQTDENLGATRIDQAARGAVAQLKTQRENERLNAVNLVNAGAGEDAVLSAQAGLRNSLENVSTQQKANLFGDLFTSGADAFASQNYNQALAAQLAQYQKSLGAFFPTKSSGGAVTPSG